MKIDYMKPLYKRVKIVDKTHRVLSNGSQVPTALNMDRRAKKIAYAT